MSLRPEESWKTRQQLQQAGGTLWTEETAASAKALGQGHTRCAVGTGIHHSQELWDRNPREAKALSHRTMFHGEISGFYSGGSRKLVEDSELGCNLSGDIKGSICHDVENRLQGSKSEMPETGWETLAIIKT